MADHPRRLGKYDIVGILGRGGMGTVYRGFDPSIERVVALKTIRRDLQSGVADAVARFRNEARAAGRLAHPAIVAVYEYGEDQDVTFIAMEYVEGFGLKEYLSQIGVMPLTDSVSVVMQLLDGLAYAHEQGVVHRDIKPSNLIITSKGKVKITDFGVAHLEASELTQVGTVIGTPSYMSPEQFMGLGADSRSDVFSVGVMLYELLTGQRPFTGSMEALAYKICHESAARPSQVEPSIPGAFDTLIERAMAKRADERFPTAGAFRDALRLALEHELDIRESAQISEETVIRTVGRLDRERIDFSSPTALSSPGSSMRTSTRSATTIENKTLSIVERQLASYIGPVAAVMVRKAARSANTVNELYDKLAESLPDGADRRAFLAYRGSAVAAGETGRTTVAATRVVASGVSVELPQPTLDAATRLLAQHIGPIAKVVVRRAAKRVDSLDALWSAIADEVPEPGARDRLIAELQRLS